MPVTTGRQFQMVEVSIPDEPPVAEPAISVCMIVKNEAGNIGECLRSISGLGAEVIVVDTGSTDETASIARGMGAMVYSFPWKDDFALARNESLRHARKGWVFWLDADDRVSQKAIAQLKRAASSGIAEAFTCRVISDRSDGGSDITDHVRFFRNGMGISFAGAVHETPLPDLVRLGLKLGRTDIEIRHVGYDASPEVRGQKSARNLAIINRELVKRPDDANLLFYRGQALGGVGELDGTIADMRAFLGRTAPGPFYEWQRNWCYVSLVRIFDLREQRAQLSEVLEQALAEFPNDSYFLLLSSRVLLSRNQPEDAVERAIKARDALATGPGIGFRPPQEWMSLTLAEGYRGLAQQGEALFWARKAHEEAPGWDRAAALLSRVLVHQGALEEAEAVLAPFADRKSAEVWVATSELRRAQGREVDAQEAASQAQLLQTPSVDIGEKLLEATQSAPALSAERSRRKARGLALLAAGDHRDAAEQFALAVEESPQDPDGYRYLAVALKGLGQEEQALEAWRLALHWEKAR